MTAATITAPYDGDTASGEGWTATTWREHQPRLVRYATSLLGGDRPAAEDVVQEAALRYWHRADRLVRHEALDGWLRTVVRRLVIDRSRRVEHRLLELHPDPQPPAAVTPDLAERIGTTEITAALLARLAPHHRAAVVEVYMLDHSVAEAARRLGIPVGTVKSRCHAALRILREHAADPR